MIIHHKMPTLRGRAFQSPAWRRRALRYHGFRQRVEKRPCSMEEWKARPHYTPGIGSRVVVWEDPDDHHEIHGTEAAWQVLSRRLAREDRCW